MNSEGVFKNVLYSSLDDLNESTREATIAVAPTIVPPSSPEVYFKPGGATENVSGRFSNAAREAAALARAEARLDSELIRKVFSLTTAVMRASRNTVDKEELGKALDAFRGLMKGIVMHPPIGARSFPYINGSVKPPGDMATSAQADKQISAAVQALSELRKLALEKTQKLTDKMDTALEWSKIIAGSEMVVGEPTGFDRLVARSDSLKNPDVSGMIAELQAEYDDTYANYDDISGLRRDVASAHIEAKSAAEMAEKL